MATEFPDTLSYFRANGIASTFGFPWTYLVLCYSLILGYAFPLAFGESELRSGISPKCRQGQSTLVLYGNPNF